MKKYLFVLVLVLSACANDTSTFKDLCAQNGGTVEVADDIYCTKDYNGDGTIEGSEICGSKDYAAGACSLN